MTKFIKILLITINILVVFGILMVKIGSTTNPNQWLLPSYFAFFLFPLALINLFFLVFWAILKKWLFLISMFCFLFFLSSIKSSFPINFIQAKSKKNNTKITFLSYNTMAMGMFQKHTSETPNPIVQYILNTNADIICLQEFAISENKNQFQKEDFERLFHHYPYKHIKYKINKWQMHQGLITLSKYPIIHKQDIEFDAKVNLSIYSDILYKNDTIRVINNHLESNRITAQDMKNTSVLANDFNSDKLTDITKILSQKVSSASKVRATQADKVAEVIKNTPYKIIVCGDFNDVPASYTYTKIKGKLKDAYCETKTGLGWTFNRSFFRFRIDYILHDNSFVARNYKKGYLDDSDHYPIQVDLYEK